MSSVVDTLAEFVRINSVNPAYGDDGSEANLVPLVRQFFEARGIEVWEQEVFPGRNNVIARLPGKTQRRIVLEAHMDTVSIKGMSTPPFEPTIENGRMHGRGSVDDKAGLVAMMHAVASFKEDGIVPECEVWLAAVVDEEYSFRGVVKLCEGLTADGSIVAEPTELRAVIASKGVLRWRIHTIGKASHSSKPHLGINAISSMARLTLAIEGENERLAAVKHPLLGPATINVGVINGGVQVNFVPDKCTIEIDRRLLPGESAQQVLADMQSLLDSLAAEHPGFRAEMELPPMLVDDALETAPTEAIVRAAQQVLSGHGLNGEVCGVPFGSDASKLARIGIPTIVLGPGSIDQAHAADEYVELAQVEKAVQIYRECVVMLGAILKE